MKTKQCKYPGCTTSIPDDYRKYARCGIHRSIRLTEAEKKANRIIVEKNRDIKKRNPNYSPSKRTKLTKDELLNRKLLRQYNITLDEYSKMRVAQRDRCAICHFPASFVGSMGASGRKSLCIDHNHMTGEVRALLCSRCNTALGLLQENLSTALNMVDYMRKHPQCPIPKKH